jgi:hypothetical protein
MQMINVRCWAHFDMPTGSGIVPIRRRPQAEQSAPEPVGVFLVEPDELDQVFDSEVGERLNAVLSDAIDPDYPVLDLHFYSELAQPIFVFAEVLGDG